MNVYKGIVSFGNGGDGIRLGAGFQGRLENITSEGNKGNGLSVHPDSIAKINGAVLSGNNKGGLVVERGYGELLALFPILSHAEPADVVEAAKSVATACRGTEVVSLRSSKVGEWLENQNFVDWAALAVAIVSLIPR